MRILPGLDALLAGQQKEILEHLKTQKVGLLTNQTGQTHDNIPAWEALRDADVSIRTLFSPEHGPRGILEGNIESSSLSDGTPIFSLYSPTKRPTPAMLEGLDVLICDLQDVGARFYTYSSTIFEALEACHDTSIRVVICDRPNPLGGISVEGPLLESELESFIGLAPLPVTHGMTLGELALFYRDYRGLNVEIEVVQVQGWTRAIKWNETGLQWRQPSPNLPDFRAAAWYSGLALLEFCALCVGRGTEAPFQILAAPDFESERFIAHFESSEGITACAIKIVPTRATFEGQPCRGVRFEHHDGFPMRPVEFGLRVMAALRASHPDFPRDNWDKAGKLVGSQTVLDLLWGGNLRAALEKSRTDAEIFRQSRAPFLLY